MLTINPLLLITVNGVGICQLESVQPDERSLRLEKEKVPIFLERLKLGQGLARRSRARLRCLHHCRRQQFDNDHLVF